MVKVKVCGIQSLEEALLAVEAGADAIGFVFAKSRRQIKAEKAREISRSLPPFISRVGVFVNEEHYVVQEIAGFCELDVLQFHGDESPEYCRRFSQRLLKAFAVQDELFLAKLPAYKQVHAFILDAFHPDLRGGTGQTFNWELAVKAKEYGPVILAGGLNAGNVGRAILKVQPYAVDVSSGVEVEGKKSGLLLADFFQELRRSIHALSKTTNA